jgi:LacI family transcriptional regulator
VNDDAAPANLGKVTVRAVAARAGVAVSSVSRVLNGHAEVSDELRARVHKAVEELGYQPNLLARSLRSGSTHTIGMIIRDVANPLFADVIKGAESVLHDAGYSVLVSNTDGDVARDVEYIDLFLRRRVDGMLLTLQSEENEDMVAALQAAQCPLVLLDRDVPALSASAVLCDHQSGMTDAVEHLLALGHRRIGLINAPAVIRPARERQRGCLDALARAGVPLIDELVRVAPYSEEFGYTSTMELLDLPEPPTAILSDGIQFTLGSLRALRERRVRIGPELSFVSADDIAWLELHDPPISVVHRDHTRIGELGAELLLHALRPGTRPRFEPVATTYLHRASVQRAPH